jgi:hypothetical protein
MFVLVSERVNSLLFGSREKIYIPRTGYKHLHRAFRMNVFLSGPGSYSKSNLIKFVLDFYKIPYTVVGYKDMPVDALLGIPDMSKLLMKASTKSQFQGHLSINQGSL